MATKKVASAKKPDLTIVQIDDPESSTILGEYRFSVDSDNALEIENLLALLTNLKGEYTLYVQQYTKQ